MDGGVGGMGMPTKCMLLLLQLVLSVVSAGVVGGGGRGSSFCMRGM